MPNSTFRTFYRYRYLIHLAFWLIWGAFYYMAAQRSVKHVLINFISFVPCTYFIIWYTHRTINSLYRKFESKVIIRWLLLWFLSGFVFAGLDNYFYQFFFGSQQFLPLKFFYEALYSLFFVISIPVTIELIFSLLKNTLQLQEIQREKFYAEKQLLMSQINPHFLFNTLNNIYSLSLDQSPKLPTIILEMSDLLRYMLTLSKRDYISLAEEVDYIRNYIEMEKLRVDSPDKIRFTCTNIDSDLQIAPIVLLPIVENAFKHGNTIANKMRIDIEIVCEKKELSVTVINNKRDISSTEIEKERTSIGLRNLSKRLAILYPDRHLITTIDEMDMYKVKLWIKLHE